jgi:Phage integrase, N-terminal SAM-like domain
MTELIVVPQAAHWQRLKRLVLDSVSSPITRRVYNLGLDEFFEWYGREPRPGFTKATVSAWRVALEARGLGAVSINVRITAVRKLAVEAADNGLLKPELASGITRVKGVASKGVRLGNWLSVQPEAAQHARRYDHQRAPRPCDPGGAPRMRAPAVGSGSPHGGSRSAARWPMVHRGPSWETRPRADDSDADMGEGGAGCVDCRGRSQ